MRRLLTARWTLYVVVGALSAACLLPIACVGGGGDVKNEFAGTTGSCPPDPHVCTVDEVNSDACPFSAQTFDDIDSVDEPAGTFDESASADNHQLQFDADGNVTGDQVTPLAGAPAWALLAGVDAWWQYHPDNEKFVNVGDWDDENAADPMNQFESGPSAQDNPLYVLCSESVPFSVELPSEIPVDQAAVDAKDCFAMAYATGKNISDWLAAQGLDDHVLVSFPAPCPYTGARPVPPRARRAGLPVRTEVGRNPPPARPHPDEPVILNRRYSNFTGTARRAWDAAVMMLRNQQRGTAQLFERFPANSTVTPQTEILIGGTGPGGSVLTAHYGRRATVLTSEIGWAGRSEYEVVQGRLHIDDFVPNTFRDAQLLDTQVVISNLHDALQPNTVLGYQPAFIDYVAANATEHHLRGTVTRYATRQNAGQTELVVHATLTDGTNTRPYQLVVAPGRRFFDATGPLDTPRIRPQNFDTAVPNQLGAPALRIGGVVLTDSQTVTQQLRVRNINSGDVARLATADFARFNDTTVVIVGGGPAAFQNVGAILRRSNARILLVYNETSANRVIANADINVGEVLVGTQALQNHDARLTLRTTTANLSDPNVVESMRLGMVSANATTATVELRNIPNLAGTGAVRGEYVLSCVGPIDVATAIPADISVINTLEVVRVTVNGNMYPLYVRGVGGQLIFDFNASSKIARYVTDLITRGTPGITLDAATRQALGDLMQQRGALARQLSARRLAAYEEAAAGDRFIYQNIEDGKSVWPKVRLPAANDNRAPLRIRRAAVGASLR